MSENPPVLESANRWLASLLRFSVFFKDGVDPVNGPVEFENFFGFPHDKIVESPTGIVVQFQKGDNTMLSETVVSPGKVDFVIHAPVRLTLSGSVSPNNFTKSVGLDSLDEHVQVFRDQVEKFLLRTNPASISRLAVGADQQLKVPTREAGYEALNQKLHSVNLNAEKTNEFYFRINYPDVVTLKEGVVPINRLTTWTCATMKVAMKIATEQEEGGRVESGIVMAKVSGDYNTNPAFDVSVLNTSSLMELVDAFFVNADMVATKGELL